MPRPKTFRGKKIKSLGGYPAITDPGDPEAYQGCGRVHIHRIIAREKYGEPLLEGHHIHHKDHDPWNWDPENLERLTEAEHISLHSRGIPEKRLCAYCGGIKVVTKARDKKKAKVYCNPICFAKGSTKIDWPSDEEVWELVRSSNFSVAARTLGVSDNAIRKRLGVYKGS